MGWFISFWGAVRIARNGRMLPMLRISAKEAATIKINSIANWDRRRVDMWCQSLGRRVTMEDWWSTNFTNFH